jgi:nitric oxide reductase NorQ protein
MSIKTDLHKLSVAVTPEFTFVVIKVSEKGSRRYSCLAGQFIKVDSIIDVDGGLIFKESNPECNVSGNREVRGSNEPGTIVKLKQVYTIEGKDWYRSADPNFAEVVSELEAKLYIENSMQKIESYITGDSIEDLPTEPISDSDEEHPGTELDPGAIFISTIKPIKKAKKTTPVFSSKIVELLFHNPVPTVKTTGFYVDPDNWEDILLAIHRKRNILFIGDSGVGKTELAKLLAKSFDVEFSKHDIGSAENAEEFMIGSHRIKKGDSFWDFSPFYKDVQKAGILLLDEVNRGGLSINNMLFPLLDDTRKLNLNVVDSDSGIDSITRHEDCNFVGTANIGSEFTGTEILDDAFNTRWSFIKLGYPPAEVEVDLLVKRSGVSVKDAEKLVKLVTKVRDKKKNEVISKTLSIRQTIEIAEKIADGQPFKKAFSRFCINLFGPEYPEIEDLIHSL